MILVGHGSHLNADSSAPVYQHAERLRATRAFDEVVEAFWKEEPSLRDALDLVEADEVFVVPVFLAEGYFTREVLPRELGIDGATTRRDGRIIHYCPPVGTHPSLSGLILRRTRSVAGLDADSRARAALIVVGHGTERNATSGDTVYSMVNRLRQEGEFGTVTCGFLDEEPGIESVLEKVEATDIVLVPFFVAEGWHTRETIPADLGLTGPKTVRGDRTIWYTPPVGTFPEIADLILEITVDQSPAGVDRPKGVDRSISSDARDAFFEWLAASPPEGRDFLQVAILPGSKGDFRLLHREDRDLPIVSLEAYHEPRSALAIARTTDDGSYRPMRTAFDLRRGWVFPALDQNDLWIALSFLYPAAVIHWHRFSVGGVDVLTFERWAARQTAMYSTLRDLEPADVDEVVRSLCGTCLRTRLWRSESAAADFGTAADPTALCVPCREPCALFATRAREAGEGGE